jgi:regulatory protein
MRSQPRPNRRSARSAPYVPKPLDAHRLEELALAYVARFATSAAKLETYLRRKLRERGWEGESPAPTSALVERLVSAGYVDDTAYARSKSGSLLRRGLGERRIGQALGAAGIAAEVREEVRSGQAAQRRAALVLAAKRRFGPFGDKAGDRAGREKQIGAMLRGGHPLDSARELVNATSVEAAEQWAAGADEDEPCD